jgi:predicted nucleotidyltransferase
VTEAKDIERIIRYFEDRAEVSALYLFGSTAKGKSMRESDIDIAVLLDKPELKKKDIERFRKKYYGASPHFSLHPVDIVILNSSPTFLKYQVIKTGKVLFDRNRKLRVNFTERTINDYLDFKPNLDIHLKAVARRFREKTVGR